MTSEIVVMNKFGAAIAADSAVTISNGKIYNSATKVFRINNNSIGIMFYGLGELISIPVDIIVSSFNKENVEFDSLNSCADLFITFLVDFLDNYVSDDANKHYLKSYLINIYEIILQRTNAVAKSQNIELKFSTTPDSKTQQILNETISAVEKEIGQIENVVFQVNTKTNIDNLLKELPVLNKEIDDDYKRNNDAFNNPFNSNQQNKIHKICTNSAYKKWNHPLSTGIVLIGYGKKDIFPQICSYIITGRYNKELIYYSEDLKCIDEIQNTVAIYNFAQSEMTITFMEGIHPNIKEYQKTYWNKLLNEDLSKYVYSQISEGLIPTKQQEMSSKLEHIFKDVYVDYTTKLDDVIKHFNTNDIIGVCGSLPIDELGLMAETIVNINSFRKKLSQEPATVGGPTDVAIISKKDGFLWVNKKEIKSKS
jgi:hypothetical protein